MGMRIGFAKMAITPPLGTELGGYAGYRPCAGIHDPLYCKAVVLEQDGVRYGLIALDLMCADESLHQKIAEAVADLGLSKERLIVCAIHSHAAPAGLVPGEGALAKVNSTITPRNAEFADYIRQVIDAAAVCCGRAAAGLERFEVRTARGAAPAVGSERHTGKAPIGELTVVQIKTESGKNLIIYNFPCHPTVTNAANLLISTDFVAGIEAQLGADMAIFLNGAAGDISTRYTRRESSFTECERMGKIAVGQVLKVMEDAPFVQPTMLKGIHTNITLDARQVDTLEDAENALREHTKRWQEAVSRGEDKLTVRTLKSFVEGAGVNLEFAQTMGGIRELNLPVTVFRFCGLDFVTVPGELFSTLKPENTSVIAYANGYYRYICDENAYEAGYYEAMAAIIARGQGEHLMKEIRKLLGQLDEM